MKFSELPLNDSVLDALDAMRFEECTPIQEKSIPVILEGRDLIAVAQTGVTIWSLRMVSSNTERYSSNETETISTF